MSDLSSIMAVMCLLLGLIKKHELRNTGKFSSVAQCAAIQIFLKQ